MPHYLSKSDFKVAQTCPTKLFYKKNGYPSANEENDYLMMLADGGFPALHRFYVKNINHLRDSESAHNT